MARVGHLLEEASKRNDDLDSADRFAVFAATAKAFMVDPLEVTAGPHSRTLGSSTGGASAFAGWDAQPPDLPDTSTSSTHQVPTAGMSGDAPPEVGRLLKRFRVASENSRSWVEAKAHWAALEEEVAGMTIWERLEARAYLLVEKLAFRKELCRRQGLEDTLDLIVQTSRGRTVVVSDTPPGGSTARSAAPKSSRDGLHVGTARGSSSPGVTARSGSARPKSALDRPSSPDGRPPARPTSALPRLGPGSARARPSSQAASRDTLYAPLLAKRAEAAEYQSEFLAQSLLESPSKGQALWGREAAAEDEPAPPLAEASLYFVASTFPVSGGGAGARGLRLPPPNAVEKALGLSTGLGPGRTFPKVEPRRVGVYRKGSAKGRPAVPDPAPAPRTQPPAYNQRFRSLSSAKRLGLVQGPALRAAKLRV